MLLLLCSTVLVPYDVSANTPANNDPGVSDVPTWRLVTLGYMRVHSTQVT